ncbi:hypothetical protein RI367_001076 [Sorochytrium milnesiophthora]
MDMQVDKRAAVDNDTSNGTVMSKYRLAAEICNEVLALVLSEIREGVVIAQLCQYGDDMILERALKQYVKLERGIAMPTTLSVNDTVQHFTGTPEESPMLRSGDLVKVELGVHIDGYIATAGHTTLVHPHPDRPVRGPVADVVSAAYFASEFAWRAIRSGNTSDVLLDGVARIARAFNCSPVQGTFSNSIKRFVLDAGNNMFNAVDTELEQHNAPFQFGPNEVYTVAVYLASGQSGAAKEWGMPTLYYRNVDCNYHLKLKASRALFSHVQSVHSVFPFSMAGLDNRLRLGMSECTKNGLLIPLPVKATKDKAPVAAFRFTIMLLPNGQTLRLTSTQNKLPFVFSEHKLPSELDALFKTPTGPCLPAPKAKKTQGKAASDDMSMDVDA